VRAVRDELGLTQKEFAERAGLAEITVQRIEQAKIDPRAKTLTGIDRGAGWPAGAARAVMAGAEPPSANGSHRTLERYNEDGSEAIDEEVILRRMIELVPSIRKRYGNEQADLMVGRIVTLAVQSNLVEFVSAHLREYTAQ